MLFFKSRSSLVFTPGVKEFCKRAAASGGFGISKGEQSKALAPYVEAVVAGSVFVRTISANAGDKAALFDAVKAKALELTCGN